MLLDFLVRDTGEIGLACRTDLLIAWHLAHNLFPGPVLLNSPEHFKQVLIFASGALSLSCDFSRFFAKYLVLFGITHLFV